MPCREVIPGLRAHPTTLVFLAYRDAERSGLPCASAWVSIFNYDSAIGSRATIDAAPLQGGGRSRPSFAADPASPSAGGKGMRA
jgi:hypothetical protein